MNMVTSTHFDRNFVDSTFGIMKQFYTQNSWLRTRTEKKKLLKLIYIYHVD